MGLKHRNKIKSLKESLNLVKEDFDNKIDEMFDRTTYELQLKHYDRWKGITKTDEVDFTHPQVELESKLCDIRNLRLIRKGKHRDTFLECLSPEAQELYLNAVDEKGHRYTELEKPSVLKSMWSGIRSKLSKMFRLSRKDIQQLDEMFKDEED